MIADFLGSTVLNLSYAAIPPESGGHPILGGEIVLGMRRAVEQPLQLAEPGLVVAPPRDGCGVDRLARLPRAGGLDQAPVAFGLQAALVPIEAAERDETPRRRDPVGNDILVIGQEFSLPDRDGNTENENRGQVGLPFAVLRTDRLPSSLQPDASVAAGMAGPGAVL